ncbi:MAG: sugar ABC transporter ATP-binding protein [Chloroflexota bacterium]|nr:sugar ABC transporter ATP-binding protein [Chloroflexota bacterium]
MSAAQPYLRLEGISKSFPGSNALREACLEAYAGEAHALMGADGAGKSTLMNVLGGVVGKDAGEIFIDGRAVEIRAPRDAAAHGIAFVHQELNMLPAMSAAENIFIDRPPARGGFVDRSAMVARATKLLDRLGCRFLAEEPVEHLSTGDRQMVEIARAIKSDPRIVIFDEPTSSLTDREKRRLFETIDLLKRGGATVLYITHFVDEIFQLCERVTVMRNGRTVGTAPIDQVSTTDVVRLMIGESEQQARLSQPTGRDGVPVLHARGLIRHGVLHGIDLTLHEGEIVGLWGLLGSGRTELVRALVGLDPLDAGEVQLRRNGLLARVTPGAVHRAAGFVTEDRRGEGLLLPLSVTQNLSLVRLRRLLTRFGLVDRGREQRLAEEMTRRLRVTLASVSQPVATLSGGNQQKIVLGRWLATHPRLFFLDEPTRGLDVGAKTEILKLTVELARSGASVLLISSEPEELMRVCDRYLVMRRGEIVGELPGQAGRAQLLAAVSGAPGGAAA